MSRTPTPWAELDHVQAIRWYSPRRAEVQTTPISRDGAGVATARGSTVRDVTGVGVADRGELYAPEEIEHGP